MPPPRAYWLAVCALVGVALACFQVLRDETALPDNHAIGIAPSNASAPTAEWTRSHRPQRTQSVAFPPGLLEVLDRESSPSETADEAEAIDTLIEGLPVESIPWVLDRLLAAPDSRLRHEQVSAVLARWAAEAPAQAAEWTVGLTASDRQQRLLDQVLALWAASAPTAAVDWVQRLEAGNTRDLAVATVIQVLAITEPRTAAGLAASIVGNDLKEQASAHLAMVWSAEAWEEAGSWAAGLPPGKVRDRVFGELSISLSDRQPRTAAMMALDRLQPGPEQDRAVTAIVQRWSQSAPAEAAGWIEGFPDRPVRDATVDCLVRTWAGQDPNAAAAWVKGLPQGPLRDLGLGAFGCTVNPSNAQAALGWISAITNADLRERLLAAVSRDLHVTEHGERTP